jgi:hypothetical protein
LLTFARGVKEQPIYKEAKYQPHIIAEDQIYSKLRVMDAQLYSLKRKKIVNLLSFLSPLIN